MGKGDRSQESGVRSQESGVRSQESGVRSQESGVRSQESGVRSQEPGARSQEPGASQGGRGEDLRRNSRSASLAVSEKSGARGQRAAGKFKPSPISRRLTPRWLLPLPPAYFLNFPDQTYL
jgi:hypothetical protein